MDSESSIQEEQKEQRRSGKEAYEARKREKEALKQSKHKEQKRSRSGKQFAVFAAIVLVIAAAGYGFFLFARNTVPQTEDLSSSFTSQGRDHIPVGQEHDAYNSNPPTSGPHYEEPARPGFREGEDIADEHLVHSLEHGLIWISYQPDVSETVVEALKDFDDGLSVITERAANDFDIAVAAWGRLDTFDVGDEMDEGERSRIQDFINRHVNRGPESIPSGAHSGI